MRVALIQFTSWDKLYGFDQKELLVDIGQSVVVNTEFGTEIGKVVAFQELAEQDLMELGAIKPIDRLANKEDLALASQNNSPENKEAAIDYCHQVVKRHGLEMKLVDCHFSYDGRRLTFAFIADGRVDFRNLVKELAKHFQKSIRLYQLGVRDEAKISGDIGPCGIGLCCRGYLKRLGNVTSELAQQQQVVHRGSERLSGVCGRLKCCLAYEKELYDELAEKLPAIGARVKTKHGRGEVIGWHTLKGSVDVRIDAIKDGDEQLIVEVPIKE